MDIVGFGLVVLDLVGLSGVVWGCEMDVRALDDRWLDWIGCMD